MNFKDFYVMIMSSTKSSDHVEHLNNIFRNVPLISQIHVCHGQGHIHICYKEIVNSLTFMLHLGMRMVLGKILDQYLSSCQTRIKSIKGFAKTDTVKTSH